MQPRTPDEVLKLVTDEGIEFIDYRFCDLPGLMQHVSVPASQLSEDVFTSPRATASTARRSGASSRSRSRT